MAEQRASTPAATGHDHRKVPRLPQQLVDPRPIVLLGTLMWLAGTAYFALLGWSAGNLGTPFWTCLVGSALGGVGYIIFRWQRSAANRGSRGSWQGLTGLDD